MPVLTCKKNSHSILVSFSGDATVKSISRIKNGFSKLINESIDIYKLDLSSIKEVDFTFLQLLIAFQNKIKSLNKELLLLNYSDNLEFAKVASLCGIDASKIFRVERE